MPSPPLTWRVTLEHWPYREPFVIARGVLPEAFNLLIEVSDGRHRGRGECEPHESSVERARQAQDELRDWLNNHGATLSQSALQELLPAGPLRNAVDLALWDLAADRLKTSVARLIDLELPKTLPITATLSLAAPDAMAAAARDKAPHAHWLKLKLGSDDGLDAARLNAVRAACPSSRLLVDANGGWTPEQLAALQPVLCAAHVLLLEQPLPPGADAAITTLAGQVPICADESVTDRQSLRRLPAGYSAINIKLDKCGGLTEGLELLREARARNLAVLIGSNGGTSLAAAPAYLLASLADYVDIDSPTLLREDRPAALEFRDGQVTAPTAALWGGAAR
ncbi:MAG: enolase C-terminal domain-like protein [Pseudomonadota bacterium]